jgi:hypothetical protein
MTGEVVIKHIPESFAQLSNSPEPWSGATGISLE